MSRVRLMIDFPSVHDMLDWVKNCQIDAEIPLDTAVYKADALDTMKPGITPANTYLLRRDGDRSEDQKAKP